MPRDKPIPFNSYSLRCAHANALHFVYGHVTMLAWFMLQAMHAHAWYSYQGAPDDTWSIPYMLNSIVQLQNHVTQH